MATHLSLKGWLNFFACELLWAGLSLHEHLVSDSIGDDKEANLRSARWKQGYSQLTHWSLETRFFPFDVEAVDSRGQNELFRSSDTLSDELVLKSSRAISTAALSAYQDFPAISVSDWRYCFYVVFLHQVMSDIVLTLMRHSESSKYYERFSDGVAIANEFDALLMNESPAANLNRLIDDYRVELIILIMHRVATNLGAEWRTALEFAANGFG